MAPSWPLPYCQRCTETAEYLKIVCKGNKTGESDTPVHGILRKAPTEECTVWDEGWQEEGPMVEVFVKVELILGSEPVRGCWRSG